MEECTCHTWLNSGQNTLTSHIVGFRAVCKEACTQPETTCISQRPRRIRVQAPRRPSEGHCPSRRPAAPSYTVLLAIFGHFAKLNWILSASHAQNRSKSVKTAPKSAKIDPKGSKIVQNRSKMIQNLLKSVQNGPKSVKIVQNCSKSVQNAPKWCTLGQNRSKMLQNWSKPVQNWSKTDQNGPKCSKIVQNRSKFGVNRSKLSKMVPNGSKLVQIGPKWSETDFEGVLNFC